MLRRLGTLNFSGAVSSPSLEQPIRCIGVPRGRPTANGVASGCDSIPASRRRPGSGRREAQCFVLCWIWLVRRLERLGRGNVNKEPRRQRAGRFFRFHNSATNQRWQLGSGLSNQAGLCKRRLDGCCAHPGRGTWQCSAMDACMVADGLHPFKWNSPPLFCPST